MRIKGIEVLIKDDDREAMCWICEKAFPRNEMNVKEIFISNWKHKRILKGYSFKCYDCEENELLS